MTLWFEGDGEIECTIEQVKDAYANHGEHFVAVVSLLPGLTSVELLDQGSDSVTIRTNEGLMKRTSIAKRIEAERVAVEFDEEYRAGSRVTVTSHYRDEFTTSGSGVKHRLLISDVEAPGLLGFFYKRFGASKMGKTHLAASKTRLSTSVDWPDRRPRYVVACVRARHQVTGWPSPLTLSSFRSPASARYRGLVTALHVASTSRSISSDLSWTPAATSRTATPNESA